MSNIIQSQWSHKGIPTLTLTECNATNQCTVDLLRLVHSCSVRQPSSRKSGTLYCWQLQPFLFFSIFLHHIFQNTCRLFRFVSFFFPSFSFLFFLLCFSFFSLFLWSGLCCCVLVPGTLALHLLYLDEYCLTVWLTLFNSRLRPQNLHLSRMNQHGLCVH